MPRTVLLASTVANVSSVAALTVGDSHACALLSNGTARCWGSNYDGQLGNGAMSMSPSPVNAGLIGIASLDTGDEHSCVLVPNGTVRCWGANQAGQLGDGTTTASGSAVNVSGLTGATAVAVGAYHSCALLGDGTVRCWGLNAYGQLGHGSNGNFVTTPVAVSGLTGVTAISAGSEYTCAMVGGTLPSVKCWGYNGSGQLGNGTLTNSNVPVTVGGLLLAGPVAVTAGGSHTCVRLGSGGAKCWGRNSNGQLGNNSATSTFTSPTDVVDFDQLGPLANIVAVSAGQNHTCAIVSGGSGYCWGYNGGGQLGNATTAMSRFPVGVLGLSGATSISAGADHSCAALADFTLRCWGENGSHQLGGSNGTYAATPVSVTGITAATAVAAGGSHTCARLETGAIWCWGSNESGQLGHGMWWYPTALVAQQMGIALP